MCSYPECSCKKLPKAIAVAVSVERKRCARIADEYANEVLPVDPGGVARLIAGRIEEE
jgi:hypothetical protein